MSKRLNLIGMMLFVASTLVCACSGSKGNKNVIDSNEKEQKAIEKEEADIKKSQDMLSQEALQRRVAELHGADL